MKEEFRKAKTNHIDGNYEFIIDCGDLYFRENVSFEDDLEYCKSIIELYNPIKIKSIKVGWITSVPALHDCIQSGALPPGLGRITKFIPENAKNILKATIIGWTRTNKTINAYKNW